MRRVVVAIMVVLLVGACGSGGDDTNGNDSAAAVTQPTNPPTTVTNPPDTVELAPVQISVVEFSGDGYIRLLNVGAEAADLIGHWMVQQDSAVDLGALIGASIPAGGSFDVPATGLGGVAAAGGEIAVFGGSDYGDASALVGFVQWGTGGSHEAVAVEAGLWPAGMSVEPDPAYSSIELFGDPANPESWS